MNRHEESGAALIELLMAFVALSLVALCFLGLTQLFFDYQHLSAASRATARYATKADVDPATGRRRPTTAYVQAFALQSASPLDTTKVAAALSADNQAGRPGDELAVTLTYPETGGAYGVIAGLIHHLHRLGLPTPPPTLHATTVAAYE